MERVPITFVPNRPAHGMPMPTSAATDSNGMNVFSRPRYERSSESFEFIAACICFIAVSRCAATLPCTLTYVHNIARYDYKIPIGTPEQCTCCKDDQENISPR